jgi:hypothetical protein
MFVGTSRSNDMRPVLLFGVFWLLSAAICATAAQTIPEPDLISVDLEPSRSQLVAGEGIGIIAKLKNVSKSAVYFRETSVVLTLPLEMEGQRVNVTGYPAFFPTEPHKLEDSGSYERYFRNTLRKGVKSAFSY